MTLYDDLGVDKGADPDAIKSAYRKLAKETHPDQEGGDETRFKKVSHAYMILSNPDKRERYDKSGDEDNLSQEERDRAEAMEFLTAVLTELLTMAEFDPAEHDPIKAARKVVRARRKQAEGDLEEILTKAKKIGKAIKRLKSKKKVRLRPLMEHIAQGLDRDRAREEHQIAVCDIALEILADHSYEIDPKPVQQGTMDPARAAEVAEILKTFAARAGRSG